MNSPLEIWRKSLLDISRDGTAAWVTFGAGPSVGVLEIQVVASVMGRYSVIAS